MTFYICHIRRESWESAPAISSLVVWQALGLVIAEKGRNIDSDPEVSNLVFGLFVISSNSLGVRSN